MLFVLTHAMLLLQVCGRQATKQRCLIRAGCLDIGIMLLLYILMIPNMRLVRVRIDMRGSDRDISEMNQ
ncbi:hypothetical protein D3C74_465590 [compost metagenome]